MLDDPIKQFSSPEFRFVHLVLQPTTAFVCTGRFLRYDMLNPSNHNNYESPAIQEAGHQRPTSFPLPSSFSIPFNLSLHLSNIFSHNILAGHHQPRPRLYPFTYLQQLTTLSKGCVIASERLNLHRWYRLGRYLIDCWVGRPYGWCLNYKMVNWGNCLRCCCLMLPISWTISTFVLSIFILVGNTSTAPFPSDTYFLRVSLPKCCRC
jgi:hypothetical protein